MADTASYAAGMSMLTYTDINGNFSDTLDLYDSAGVVFAYADNNCNNTGASNVFVQSYSFGPNLPSTVSCTASFITCSSNSGGGSGSGGVNCKAEFEIDTSLTGSGQIVLYNTSKVNSNSVLNSPFVMYEWFWGNGASSLGSLPSYQYTTSGPIDICLEQSVFDSQGNLLCSDLFCDSLYIDTAGNVSFKGVNVSVNVFAPGQMSTLEETQVDFEVFPNPTSNIVNIEPLMEGSFQLFNELGQMLDEGAIQSTYDLTNYENGVYILLLQTAKESRHIKLIKQ